MLYYLIYHVYIVRTQYYKYSYIKGTDKANNYLSQFKNVIEWKLIVRCSNSKIDIITLQYKINKHIYSFKRNTILNSTVDNWIEY